MKNAPNSLFFYLTNSILCAVLGASCRGPHQNWSLAAVAGLGVLLFSYGFYRLLKAIDTQEQRVLNLHHKLTDELYRLRQQKDRRPRHVQYPKERQA